MWKILDVIDKHVILHNFILTHENADEPFFNTARLPGLVLDPVGPLPDDKKVNRPA